MSYLIIGGTEKAGTTSVFEYLAIHPQVRPSIRKETDYFRQSHCSEYDYQQFFSRGGSGQVCVEASPGYLGLASEVAPRIHHALPQSRLLFILRDPVERFQSSYRFHRSKYFIPDDLDIDTYTEMCLAFDEGKIALADTPFENRWFMDVLPAGRYASHLKHYIDRFDERVMLLDFDYLNRDPATVMQGISRAMGIDEDFYRDFEFFRSNSTFQGKLKPLHSLGMKVNDRMEPLLRRHPRLKRRIVDMYRRVNGASTPEGATLSPASAQRLRDYYYREVEQVRQMFQGIQQQDINWRYFHAA